MKKRLLTLVSSIVLTVAMTLPVFAASQRSSTVMKTPVSVPTAVLVEKGYTLTEAEMAVVATTPEQAVALATGITGEVSIKLENGVMFGSLPAAPAMIAMAKADILKNAELQKLLAKYGVTGYPTTFALKKDGNFLGYMPGYMTEDVMNDVIHQLTEA